MSILTEIVQDVRERIRQEKKDFPLPNVRVRSSDRRSLKESIRKKSDFPVIGELKRSSPSAGIIRRDFRPSSLAKSIEKGGAVGISVLTEPEYFGGKLEYVGLVRESVDLPVLRKDFILDEYQLYRAAETCADSVLLISEVLGEDIPRFVDRARELGMEPLVEVRNEEHARLARMADADLIGINNRDLKKMEIDLSRTENLIDHLPDDAVTISESGISSREDIERVIRAGADAALVGTSIMESQDVKAKVRELAVGDNYGGD